MQSGVLDGLRIPSDWSLEVGLLSEMLRNYAANRICQVEVADSYDHKHQDLSPGDACRGQSRMSLDVAKALFKKLAAYGMVFDAGTIRTAKACYYRIALDLIESFANEAAPLRHPSASRATSRPGTSHSSHGKVRWWQHRHCIQRCRFTRPTAV